MSYSIKTNLLFDETIIIRHSDKGNIPFDPANTDYQQYLEWVAEGNTPEEWNPEEII